MEIDIGKLTILIFFCIISVPFEQDFVAAVPMKSLIPVTSKVLGKKNRYVEKKMTSVSVLDVNDNLQITILYIPFLQSGQYFKQ